MSRTVIRYGILNPHPNNRSAAFYHFAKIMSQQTRAESEVGLPLDVCYPMANQPLSGLGILSILGHTDLSTLLHFIICLKTDVTIKQLNAQHKIVMLIVVR